MDQNELSQEELDETVIDHACRLASNINNAGRDEQIAFLERGTIVVPPEQIKVIAFITSDEVVSYDLVPTRNSGVCRYWISDNSPLPNRSLFVVFNREPVSEEEAFQTALGYFH